VVGTRPEAIKMAPVVHALREHDPEIETRVVFTGQHTELVDSVLDVLELAPDYDLGIMREGQTLYDVVHAALHGLRDVVREADPDLILVQGDTATVFVAALVGFFEGVGVGHVEAGLRSGNKRSPFPEEVLRRLTDVIADLYFAPTANARDLLLAEGTPAHDVYVTGNTVVDALRQVSALERPVENPALREVLSDPTRRLVLLTAHRRESFGAPLRAIFGAVRALAEEVGDIEIVYPVHPNPNVLEPARELLGDHPRIRLVEPLSYVDLVAALRSASLVLTDSGGIQEEAPTFGVPVLVLREVTERPEGLRARVAELVGTDPDRILERACEALGRREPSAPAENPYGDGSAAARIADIIVARLTGRARKTRDWTG
jgi:UDP-N-acetylglucosamine 2-epimerase (non-hydrolysing)